MCVATYITQWVCWLVLPLSVVVIVDLHLVAPIQTSDWLWVWIAAENAEQTLLFGTCRRSLSGAGTLVSSVPALAFQLILNSTLIPAITIPFTSVIL